MAIRLEVHYAALLQRTGSSPGHLRCRGLTNIIKERYYPDYMFTGRTRTAPALPKQRGMSRGRRVDREVQLWIQVRTQTLPVPKVRRQAPHPFSRAFVALMQRLELRPLGAQVVVRCEHADLATLVDCVFLNAQNSIVLVELKCGFEGYVDRANADMRGDFKSLTNAPKNQHQIQLAFTRCMFERTFPEFGRVDALVVRMTDTGAHVRSVDSEVDRIAREVFARGRRV